MDAILIGYVHEYNINKNLNYASGEYFAGDEINSDAFTEVSYRLVDVESAEVLISGRVFGQESSTCYQNVQQIKNLPTCNNVKNAWDNSSTTFEKVLVGVTAASVVDQFNKEKNIVYRNCSSDYELLKTSENSCIQKLIDEINIVNTKYELQ